MKNSSRSQRFCLSSIFIIITLLLATTIISFAETNKTDNFFSLRSLHTPPKLLGPKANHAWRLYEDYKKTLETIKNNQKTIDFCKHDLAQYKTGGLVGAVAITQEKELIAKLTREKEIREKNRQRLVRIQKAWNNNNFEISIGDLSLTDTVVDVKYNKDPSRPLNKRQVTTMDKIEMRLRAWHSTDGYNGQPIEKPARTTQPTAQNTPKPEPERPTTQNKLTPEERRTHIMNRLQQLSHKKQLAVMKALDIEVPVSFYNCLCRNAGYGSGSTSQFYHPDTLGKYDKRYSCQHPGLPCIVSGYGCSRYPLPSDPKVWENCMKSQRVNTTKNEDGKTDPNSGERLDTYIERVLRERKK